LIVSLDTLHVARDTVGLRVRLKVDWSVPHRAPRPGRADSTARFSRLELDEYLNCDSTLVRDIELQAFDSSGTRVGVTEWGASSQWIPFAKHASGPTYFQYACAGLRYAHKL